MRPEIDLEAFAAAQADGAFVVDVREPGEYVEGHVPGARLVPLAQVIARVGELPQRERVYVICASGNRSKTATDWLRSRGLDAVSVTGGTSGWIAQGRPVVRGAHAGTSAA
jgi:rhodanese-related sulfurtransferase